MHAPGELQKLRYTLEFVKEAATKGSEWFAPPALDEGAAEVLDWQSSRSDQELQDFREKVMSSLEFADREQRESGLLDSWWVGAEADMRQVAGTVSCCFSTNWGCTFAFFR